MHQLGIAEESLRHEVRAMLQPKLGFGDLLVDELTSPDGSSRIDLALLNGHVGAYELKSDFDSLLRLPSQINGLAQFYDRLTLVTTRKHFTKAENILPDYWGLIVASKSADRLKLHRVRRSKLNPHIDIKNQLRFLWLDDLKKLARNSKLPAEEWNHLRKDSLCNFLVKNRSKRILTREFRVAFKDRLSLRLAQR